MHSEIICTGNKVTVTTGHLKAVFNRHRWDVAADIIAMLQESLLAEQKTIATLTDWIRDLQVGEADQLNNET